MEMAGHLYDELLVGDDHLAGAEGPVVDGSGRGLRHAAHALLWPPPRADQLDRGRDLGLDWGCGDYIRNVILLHYNIFNYLTYSARWAAPSCPRRAALRSWRCTCRPPSHFGWPARYVLRLSFHCSLKYFVQTRQNKKVLTDLMELYLRAGNLLGWNTMLVKCVQEEVRWYLHLILLLPFRTVISSPVGRCQVTEGLHTQNIFKCQTIFSMYFPRWRHHRDRIFIHHVRASAKLTAPAGGSSEE